MRTICSLRIPVACVLAVALCASCGSPVKPDPPQLATFTVSGAVRSSADQSPVESVTVSATGIGSLGKPVTMTATSDAEGRYTISGLRDQVAVRATRVGFFTTTSTIELKQSQSLDLTMQKAAPTLLEGGDLELDRTISGSIGPTDDRCDPNWDRQSPCRRFGLAAPVQRSYRFTLKLQTCDEVELHVMQGGYRWLYLVANGSADRSVELPSGVYEVRLMAYYTCGLFELTVR